MGRLFSIAVLCAGLSLNASAQYGPSPPPMVPSPPPVVMPPPMVPSPPPVVVNPPPAPTGNPAPTTAGGHIALTRPPDEAGDNFLDAFAGAFHDYGYQRKRQWEQDDEEHERKRMSRLLQQWAEEDRRAWEEKRKLAAADAQRRHEQILRDMKHISDGLRDDAAKPPVPPAANPPAAGEPPPVSILDQIDEPDPLEYVRAMMGGESKPPLSPEEQAQEDKAQHLVDKIFSGNAADSDKAKKEVGWANQEVRERAIRKINDRIRRIVNDAMRASRTASAGAPRTGAP